MPRLLVAALAALCLSAAPAAAQWTPVPGVPPVLLNAVSARGDTLVAGSDSTVFVSTDAGATWAESAPVASGTVAVEAVLVHRGRLYAGTYGQGVRVSDDLGVTWAAFNQGLVGGLFDSQLFVVDLLARGDSVYAATAGAGAWVRGLVGATTWSHFGNAFEPNQASNMNALAASDTRLLGAAGFNGTVFFRDRGDADWTLSWLDNVGIQPGLAALSAAWTGGGWVVGSNVGVFHSATGQEPWAFTDPGLGTLFTLSFAPHGSDLYAVFGLGPTSVTGLSQDHGATWALLDTLTSAFTSDATICGGALFAARADGLWRRTLESVSVPEAPRAHAPRLALVGAQPAGERVRFRVELPAPALATLEVFDVAGRRMPGARSEWRPAGAHEWEWDARALGPGVYHARLTVGGEHAVARFVRAR